VDYKALGEKIKKERQRLRLTQEKLAEKINISESFMGHIERGERKLSIETLVSLAQELNISIDYLLLDSIKPEPTALLNEISTMLANKKPEQQKSFIALVRVLVNNMDEWV
jgi:transcriptional regulator with XRE-family HTH domain